MRGSIALTAAAAVAVAAAPLAAQSATSDAGVWNVGGLRKAFCVRLLLDPASPALRALPQSYHLIPASQVHDLHVSLRSVVHDQPEFASWSPSRVCVFAVDSVSTKDFAYADTKGKHPQLFGLWTVAAAGPAGAPDEVALSLFSNSGRLIRSARLAGQTVEDARLTMGKVPAVDEEGIPSKDDRFQLKIGKTTLTWDGRPAKDSVAVREAVDAAWAANEGNGKTKIGRMQLKPPFSRAMVGSLTVDGKGDLAKALRASPTRFAGPVYVGGSGTVTFEP
jgi:hypothetical protein